ncbi:hypothetical protein [Nocardia callitridis]|uniref:Uncharacterized protein n=1 Tax=Nocardia callitridis TaxID=648753 RepID=A0ABP9JYI5_9NOCA
MIVLITAVIVLAGIGVIFWLLSWLLDRAFEIPGAVPVGEILNRECHAAPQVPYTVEQAHRVLQVRINCDIATCSDKHAAFWTMVDSGRATPAVGVER